MKIWQPILFFLGLICLVSLAHSQDTHSVLSIADIHFDPFSSCTSSPCELIIKLQRSPASEWKNIFEKYADKKISTATTNYALLKSTLLELKAIDQQYHPTFVLALGDFLAHNFHSQYRQYTKDGSRRGYEDFVKKTFLFLTDELRAFLPDTDIYPAIGNNDSFTGNYHVVPHGKFFSTMENTWRSLLKDLDNRKHFLQTFSYAGYYAVNVPAHPQFKIIVLNTVLFSLRAKEPEIKYAAEKQLAWLNTELASAQANHKKVILAFHIPPSINLLGSLSTLSFLAFWQPSYQTHFENILKQYGSIIQGIFPAHIHVDPLTPIKIRQFSNVIIFFTPSISPVYGNNPSFKIFNYDTQNFQFKNYLTYFYPLDTNYNPAWEQYGLTQVSPHSCRKCKLFTKRTASMSLMPTP